MKKFLNEFKQFALAFDLVGNAFHAFRVGTITY